MAYSATLTPHPLRKWTQDKRTQDKQVSLFIDSDSTIDSLGEVSREEADSISDPLIWRNSEFKWNKADTWIQSVP